MKILIEESVLRQALETFTHCYAETDRRINERAKILVELRTVLDAAENVEPVAWLITTSNSNLHPLDPNRESNWLTFDLIDFKRNCARSLKVEGSIPLYAHPAPAIPGGWQPIETAPWETEVLLFGPSGYLKPHDKFFINGYRVRDWHQGGWNDATGTHLSECGWKPTHWMPLPPAPEIKP